jgi:small basic protein (TIGR04137 family)
VKISNHYAIVSVSNVGKSWVAFPILPLASDFAEGGPIEEPFNGFRRISRPQINIWLSLQTMLNTPSASFLRRVLTQATDNDFCIMSQHRSLRAAATLGGKRNVLKRFERLELLKKRGQWKVGDRITGLRKTKGEA